MMNDQATHGYKTLLEKVEILMVEKKSKFHTILFPCESVDRFEEELALTKKAYPGATHYCYAYRIKDHIVLERYSDDGEPSGTAGVPMLNVLKGQELLQCGVIVVRYFGGTKLGTGGLAGAYSEGVIQSIGESRIGVALSTQLIEVVVDYGLNGKVDYFANQKEYAVVETVFTDEVAYLFAVPEYRVEDFLSEINELTAGKGKVKLLKKVEGFFSGREFTRK